MNLADNEYIKLCELSELKENTGKRIYIDDKDIALFKVKNKVYALDNICPHENAAIIYDGYIEDGCVACPSHGWMFNLETGKMKTSSCKLLTHQVVVENDTVYVRLNKKDLQ